MIEEGVLEGVDAISGLHVWGTIPAGVIGYHAGPFMAAADEWECTILGHGGHGGLRHEPTVLAGEHDRRAGDGLLAVLGRCARAHCRADADRREIAEQDRLRGGGELHGEPRELLG